MNQHQITRCAPSRTLLLSLSSTVVNVIFLTQVIYLIKMDFSRVTSTIIIIIIGFLSLSLASIGFQLSSIVLFLLSPLSLSLLLFNTRELSLNRTSAYYITAKKSIPMRSSSARGFINIRRRPFFVLSIMINDRFFLSSSSSSFTDTFVLYSYIYTNIVLVEYSKQRRAICHLFSPSPKTSSEGSRKNELEST